MTHPVVLVLHAMGRTVRIARTPGVPKAFVAEIAEAWADCRPSTAPEDPADTDEEAADHGDSGPLILLTTPEEAPVPAGERTETYDDVVRYEGEEQKALTQQELTTSITVALIGTRVGADHLFHAASLRDPDTDRVLILVGPSGRGKTTASRALARAGWIYLSDETAAVLDETLEVLPYPKPLSIIRTPGRPKTQESPSSLGLTPADPRPESPARLAGIVLLDRQEATASDPTSTPGSSGSPAEGAVPTSTGPQADPTPRITPVPLAEGLQALAEQSSGLAATERGLERLARLAQRVGGIHRVSYAESETLDAVLRTHLADLAVAGKGTEEWEYLPALDADAAESFGSEPEDRPSLSAGTRAEDDAETEDVAGTWARDPRTSGLLAPDGLLLLRRTRSLRVSALAADLWIEAGAGRTAEELERILTDRYGPAPEGAFAAVLQELRRSGALVRSAPGPGHGPAR